MPERITIVIGTLGGGGAERVCVNLANAWAATRTVTILTTLSSASAYPLDPRVAVRRVTGALAQRALVPVIHGLEQCPNLLLQAGPIAILREAILATKPDVVISHLTKTNLRVLAALHGTGVPVIACEHTDVTRVHAGCWESERALLYRRARAVVATHPVCADFLARRGARAYAIPNALQPPAETFAGLRTGRLRSVMLSRLGPEKRVGMAVRAFARAAVEGWELHIHGDGVQREATQRLVEEWAPGRVFIHPFGDAYEILRNSDLFVSASCVEGFGNAIWEALACHVPVVAVDCGAPVRSLVRDGIDGILVRPDTTTALMEALRALMTDDARRAQLRPSVVDRFPFEAAIRRWEEVLAA